MKGPPYKAKSVLPEGNDRLSALITWHYFPIYINFFFVH